MKRMGDIAALLILIVCMAPAQKVVVPIERQIPLFLKIISANDRPSSDTGTYTIGVIYQRSLSESDSIVAIIAGYNDSVRFRRTVMKRVTFVSIDADAQPDAEAALVPHELSALLFTPVAPSLVKSYSEFCREHSIMTMSVVAKDVVSDVSVTVGLFNNEPNIMINLTAGHAEGTAFSSRLLNIATVYR